MKLIMVAGFLGSGKTSCIMSLLGKLQKEQGDNGIKLAVIENEVADVSIDNRLFEKNGLEIRILGSGCICCTLVTDLLTTLNQLKKNYDPEYVLFEPTGVANPNRIWDSIEKYSDSIEWHRQITVIDASRWNKMRIVTPGLSHEQVKRSNAVFLNKLDLAEAATVTEVRKEIRSICKDAVLYDTNAQKGIPDEIWEEIL